VGDERCAPLDDITGCVEIDCLTSNNFAFGGINTSLIFRRMCYRAMVSAGPVLVAAEILVTLRKATHPSANP
jgi:hypothetical protein